MNKKRANIILMSLNENFGKRISSLLAKQFSMDYVDCKNEIAEDIARNNILLKSFSMADLERQEESVLATCLEKRNAVIFLSYDLYRRNKILFDGQAICYLRLDKHYLSEQDIISAVSFSTRDEYLKTNASRVIKLDNLDENIAMQKIKGEIV